MTPTKTLKELAKEVIQIQDACNILALSGLFHEHCVELMGHLNSFSAVHAHPILMMWMSKFSCLTGYTCDLNSFSDAYDEVQRIANS